MVAIHLYMSEPLTATSFMRKQLFSIKKFKNRYPNSHGDTIIVLDDNNKKAFLSVDCIFPHPKAPISFSWDNLTF